MTARFYSPSFYKSFLRFFIHSLIISHPQLKEIVPAKLTMKQKEAMRRDKIEPETDPNDDAIVPRYECVTSRTARRRGITNMYLTGKYTMLQMMHNSGHKTETTFKEYIKLSSDEIADEIDAIVNGTKTEVF